jgi:hypothetical protein
MTKKGRVSKAFQAILMENKIIMGKAVAEDTFYGLLPTEKHKKHTNSTPSWGFRTNVSKANIWE